MRLQGDASVDSRIIEAMKDDDAISAFFAEVSREFPEVRRLTPDPAETSVPWTAPVCGLYVRDLSLDA